MLPSGKYSVWFYANEAEGMGVIELHDGRLSGGDTILSYAGSYTQAGDQFTASIHTARHSPGHAALFGRDDVDIAVTGTSTARTAAGVGRVAQLPDATFKVVLVHIPD